MHRCIIRLSVGWIVAFRDQNLDVVWARLSLGRDHFVEVDGLEFGQGDDVMDMTESEIRFCVCVTLVFVVSLLLGGCAQRPCNNVDAVGYHSGHRGGSGYVVPVASCCSPSYYHACPVYVDVCTRRGRYSYHRDGNGTKVYVRKKRR